MLGYNGRVHASRIECGFLTSIHCLIGEFEGPVNHQSINQTIKRYMLLSLSISQPQATLTVGGLYGVRAVCDARSNP
jgi:hypothetical protein